LIEIQGCSLLAATSFRPELIWLDEVLENTCPRVNWRQDGIVKGGKLSSDGVHLIEVLLVGVVHILEDKVSRSSSLSIVIKSLKIVKGI